MTLYTKSIFKPALLEDGLRISVMSRHTLNDGKTPDNRITPQTYHQWIQSLAPQPELVGKWYKEKIEWDEFEQAYVNHLEEKDITIIVKALARQAIETDITLLCAEETQEHCHRRLLAEECKKYEPALSVVHR